MTTPEQIIAAQKSQLEAFFLLAAKAVESLDKIAELNVQTLKMAVSEASESTLGAMSVKDAQELTSLQSNFAQPMTEKALSYSRHLYEITSAAQAEFAKALEANATDLHTKVLDLVDTALKNAPAGSESTVALVKSALTAANNAYDTVQKASKQAVKVAEDNFNTVTKSAMNATQTTGRAKRNPA